MEKARKVFEMTDLSVELCGVKLKNPTVLASGYLGVSAGSLLACAKTGAGAVTSKSCNMQGRKGNENPTVITWGDVVMNAVGLSNPGVKEEIEELEEARSELKKLGVPLVASVFGGTVEEYGQAVKEISKTKPDLIELNISCPHVESSVGRICTFSSDPQLASAVVKEAKKNTNVPIIAKLSPNVTNIAEIALAAEKAGADAIAAINTVSGMKIDVRAKRKVLSAGTGGVSGPAIKPIAVRCVHEISKAVKVPVIGIGGVCTGEDAVEMLMAGATAVGIGSATLYRGANVFSLITSEIKKFMQEEGYAKIKEIKLEE
ncbi:dihydroorotate dehydrogenase [Candidatus Micrarchaeota archaeon]|nr:dihydroorotate dehydrogenase [Candidatus Micrarchaeota archaeon]